MAEAAPKAEPSKAKVEENDDVRAAAVAAMEEVEAMTPTPTQSELDAIKRGEPGGYKTRQSKAG